MTSTPGTLFIVATPIGNLADLSSRAVEVLQSVDLIAAEDTRHSGRLLQHYQVTTRQIACHDHNESAKVASLISQLESGKNIALISDAGTPLISDPGLPLVRQVRLANIPVRAVPGPCAVIAALSVAGLPTDRFVFEGFLPAKSGPRLKRLVGLTQEPRTLIFYEAPHRVLAFLKDLQECFESTREVVLVRELTKIFETVIALPLSELIERVESDKNQQLGEIVVLVAGFQNEQNLELPSSEAQRILGLLQGSLPLTKAAALTAKITGERKKVLYDFAAQNQE